MNASLPTGAADTHGLSLDDKYTRTQGRIYLSGTQALVRLPLMQKQRDREAGLNTGGYVSGYRGSPLGGLDQALWKAKRHLQSHDVVFQPGVNEDLAATAVWGSQQLNLFPGATRDGVFGMWYGKGPGVDRSVDVLKHANSAGTSARGGVLMLAGDDHAAKSSSVAHQSEHVLIASGIPVLYPSNVQEYLDYGLHGWAMSRYTGLWVAMKCVTDVVESSASVDVDSGRVRIVLPPDALPEGGLNIRWPDSPLAQEARLLDHKWYAALAYVRANKLNRIVLDSPRAHFGIMTAGKAYLDVRQALNDLGLDEAACREAGIRVLKVGCIWPLDAQGAREFATGLKEILVVEEKRQILEYALKEELYNWRDDVRPRVYGKFDEREHGGGEWSTPRGGWLLPARHELSPALIARAIAARLDKAGLSDALRARIAARLAVIDAKEREAARPTLVEERKPWFCSGCPHNTSTRVPEGSRAVAGIGCHYMAMWMDRKTDTFSQMGGEGVAWLGQKDFTSERHIFANLGDGTYFHSGLLAIRAAVAARASITYKILYNDAVAMTGGQPVDGPVSVHAIAHSVRAEGVSRIALVSDHPEKFSSSELPNGVTIHPREDLDAVQKELREISGVTVLIYEQTCATEKRRRRKRGQMEDPKRFAYINDLVCEGCGDCSVASNCLSVEPKETPFGRKRKINLSTCNKDFSCLEGFCPSFVTVEGAARKAKTISGFDAHARTATLPSPALPALDKPFDLLVTGVGGTGVVTVGALISMAAHLEGRGVSVLDFTGFAQKFGPVLSYLRIAAQPSELHQVRIDQGAADALIGCDLVVSSSPKASGTYRHGTRAVVNTAEMPTGDVVRFRDADLASRTRLRAIERVIGNGNMATVDANALADMLLGDTVYANVMMLGFAWQQGLVPVSFEALARAIELNGVAIERNRQAFAFGRLLSADPDVVHRAAGDKPAEPETLDQIIARRATFLTAYQNAAYAARFEAMVARVRKAEAVIGSETLTDAVARSLFKLMAYKDEYEVARLHMETGFLDELKREFEGDYTVHYHLAPPLLPSKLDARGRPKKRSFGPWIQTPMKVLARLKGLRGTPLDIFGYTAERRTERALIGWYEEQVETILAGLTPEHFGELLAIAKAPMDIRGYGPVKEEAIHKVKTEVERLWERVETETTVTDARRPQAIRA